MRNEIIEEQDGLGLRIDEIITDKGKMKFELGISYSTISQDSITSYFDTIQTGTGEFIDVPLAIGASQRVADTMILSLGGRYGLSDKTELYSRASFLYSDERAVDGVTGDTTTTTGGNFSSLTLGINHRFREDDETSGVVGFADITLAENIAHESTKLAYGKSATVGLTTYRTFDPVVLSATFGYRPSFSRIIEGDAIDPADTFFFNPSIAFAANNEITLTGGVSLRMMGKEKVNGVDKSTRKTRGDLEFGLAYSLDKNTSLQFDTTAGIVGDTNLTLGFKFSKALGRF